MTTKSPSATCAVSVVMPMYNAEKYLGESLDSVLAQTLQDYEVILVNDCSTDNSRRVAESYLPKFDGRLKLYDNVLNSKASGTRNRGLLLSRGEYIFFLDSDDLIKEDALEKMYGLAKEHDADVVSLGAFYRVEEDAKKVSGTSSRNEKIFEGREGDFFVDDDLLWRLKEPLDYKFYGVPWLRMFRRDFLIGNGIFFPENVSSCEDVVWKHGFLLLAKRIVHTKLIFNYYRMSDESMTRSKRNNVQYINYRMNTIFYGIKWIDEIMNKSEFIKKNPEYRYKILADFTDDMFRRLLQTVRKRSWTDETVYSLVRQEFGKDFGKYNAMVPVLCSLINGYKKSIEDDEKLIADLEGRLKQGEIS